MTRVGGRKASTANILPSIPYYFGYISTPSTITTTGRLLSWTTKTITDNFRQSSSCSKGLTTLKLGKTGKGMYEIKVNTSVIAGGNGSTASLHIYKNGATVTKSTAYINANQRNNCNLSYFVYLEEGDTISIYGIAMSYNFVLLMNSCTFSISFVPNRGWDNNSGGKLISTAEVLR